MFETTTLEEDKQHNQDRSSEELNKEKEEDESLDPNLYFSKKDVVKDIVHEILNPANASLSPSSTITTTR